ncbi:hypothetical protein GCM10010923_23370 [Blastomonas marina]|uniref:Uncharacterized protein n=1 Tax=Blastomonas marina TaxID=1867408 RepID=A0ABQ1FGP1_9SPHN|nr:hypothetical protein [Blastomonas marina]GGA11989.1 hypothetical protein GCM10010923_23370 [Blastomonas marina]
MARILFIGIDFHSYPREIRAAGERLGHTVDFHPLEDRSFAAKTAKKLAGGIYRKQLDAYHRRIVEQSAGKDYDVVLFIQVHHMAPETVQRLRELHPSARFVLYNWDSLTTHDFTPWLPFFDHAATFDPEDAEALGIAYLPLFAIPTFFEIDRDRPKDFDLYFVGAIGTLHRFDALARLHAFAEQHGLATHFHLVCSPVMRATLLRKRKPIPGLTGKGIGFDSVIDLLERSRGTFDFANHRQSGYTMRVIENMCAERKIVTENRRILDEPFYREDRFHVVDGHDFSGVPEFLARPIESILDTSQFSIDNWLRQLVEPQGA